ncbi:hypothetical protein DTW89_16855 [Acidovorax sp. BoFeN1]|nr:hypothetical protein DTW89_16855 [Acidovorax sp. BoFeN1]
MLLTGVLLYEFEVDPLAVMLNLQALLSLDKLGAYAWQSTFDGVENLACRLNGPGTESAFKERRTCTSNETVGIWLVFGESLPRGSGVRAKLLWQLSGRDHHRNGRQIYPQLLGWLRRAKPCGIQFNKDRGFLRERWLGDDLAVLDFCPVANRWKRYRVLAACFGQPHIRDIEFFGQSGDRGLPNPSVQLFTVDFHCNLHVHLNNPTAAAEAGQKFAEHLLEANFSG